MIRKALVMSVNAGQEQEYERRHRPIWPELEATLLAHGVTNYSIFSIPKRGSSSHTRKSRAKHGGPPLHRRTPVNAQR
jgi:hypothetical protein